MLNITGQSGTLTAFNLGTAGTTDNLADLAKTINDWAATQPAGAGVTATVVGAVMTITSAGGGGVRYRQHSALRAPQTPWPRPRLRP